MISISEYAEKRQVSYEAIRKMVGRYSKDLKGHIFETANGRMLDKHAELFLDTKRRGHPVSAILEASKNDMEQLQQELEKSRSEAELAKKMILELQQQIIREKEAGSIAKDRLLELMQEQRAMIEDKAAAEAGRAVAEARAEDRDLRIQLLEKQLEEAKEESESYVKTIFGFYRKVKSNTKVEEKSQN